MIGFWDKEFVNQGSLKQRKVGIMKKANVGNPAVVFIGCKKCPSNRIQEKVKLSSFLQMIEIVGQVFVCKKCKTAWKLDHIDVNGGIGADKTLRVSMTFIPDLSMYPNVSIADMVIQVEDENGNQEA